MTPELIGRQETTNQKRRLELTLDLINARVTMSGFQRNQIREILREQFSNAIEEEREACAELLDKWAEVNIMYGRKYEAEIMTVAAKSIRARSEGEGKSQDERTS